MRLSEVTLTSLSLEELVRRWDGDERDQCSSAIYRRLGDRLWRFAYSRLQDCTLADDVVQDVFLRAWRASTRFDPAQASAKTWFFAIAHNVIQDKGRARSRWARTPGHVETVAWDRTDVVDTTILVRDALTKLSVDHREVLALAYDAGLTQQEIAEVLHLPLGTVKTRTFHALRHLRQLIGDGDAAA